MITRNTLRIAQYNVAMTSPRAQSVSDRLRDGSDNALRRISSVIAAVDPDILLLCEFDQSGDGIDNGDVTAFIQNFLIPAGGSDYKYHCQVGVNTGLPYKRKGKPDISNKPDMAQGFGFHHGQYGFALLSRFPIEKSQLRTWQQFHWKDMPENKMPEGTTPHGFNNNNASRQKVMR
ncbi:hypothetical protein CS022_08295 [Veronia nyctiphanis]|uniref:Endonuclease/exonuclease/phosphatase domain-containing protein n=1 Tax=Veronia nyctiphanis TaxID=1278244 RepID=A0A4Q0YRH6_9GAMM|nr:endonuclease/exonuclease/phosphatase family protein [Veronia nyctiphanis]RXJ73722.1 hypothetical protein CS022_08295 [Veronia nyctiphanis]